MLDVNRAEPVSPADKAGSVDGRGPITRSRRFQLWDYRVAVPDIQRAGVGLTLAYRAAGSDVLGAAIWAAQSGFAGSNKPKPRTGMLPLPEFIGPGWDRPISPWPALP